MEWQITIFGKGIHTNTIIKKACDETWEMSYDQLDGYEFDDDDDEKNWINDLNKKGSNHYFSWLYR